MYTLTTSSYISMAILPFRLMKAAAQTMIQLSTMPLDQKPRFMALYVMLRVQ